MRRGPLAVAVMALLTVAVFPAPTHGEVTYVDCQATSGTPDGTTWDTAYPYLTDALSSATAGDQVWVAACVYYPDEGAGRTDNASNQWFTIPDGVQVYGGFAGGETSLSQRDWAVNRTILSGDIEQNDVNDDGNDIAETYTDIFGTNAISVVNATNTTDPATRLDGFVVTAGQSPSYGGGIYASNTSGGYYNLEICGNRAVHSGGGFFDGGGSPRVEHVVFSGNYASGNAFSTGGGMAHLDGGHPVLVDVTFSNNEGYFGGGFGFWGDPPGNPGSATLRSCTFSDNRSVVNPNTGSPGYGGGFAAQEFGTIDLDDVTFSHNKTFDDPTATLGGGMFVKRGTVTVTNAVFFENTVWATGGDSGGGIYADLDANLRVADSYFIHNGARTGAGIAANQCTYEIVNTVFTGNYGAYAGGGLAAGADSVGTVRNSTFNGNFWNAISCWAPTSLTVTNSILWGNEAEEIKWQWAWTEYPLPAGSVTYSDVDGGWTDTGNINVDPLFVEPVVFGVNHAGGDVRLQETSPVMDAGSNDAVPADILDRDGDGNTTEPVPYDLDGNPRRMDGPVADTGDGTAPLVDMGAFEYTAGAASAVELTSSTNPSTVGHTVTLTATVSDPAVAGTPTGSVTFKDGGAVIAGCADVALSGLGEATCETSWSAAATYTLSARYSGDAAFGWSSDELAQVVELTPQTITFDDPGPQQLGTTPTLTASATSGLTVTFTSSTTDVCTITAGGTLTLLVVGDCTINADQAGDATWAPADTVIRTFAVIQDPSPAVFSDGFETGDTSKWSTTGP